MPADRFMPGEFDDGVGHLGVRPPARLPFAVTHARRTDPATSHVAAETAADFTGPHKARILRWLQAFGPAGASEIAYSLDMERGQINKRLSDLWVDGYTEPIGRTTSRSGRSERLWRIIR